MNKVISQQGVQLVIAIYDNNFVLLEQLHGWYSYASVSINGNDLKVNKIDKKMTTKVMIDKDKALDVIIFEMDKAFSYDSVQFNCTFKN